MTIRRLSLSVGLILPLLFAVPPSWAQQTSTDDLKKEIETLNQAVKAMQKDLQEIKALLQSRQAAAPPQNVVLELGKGPSKGERTAKLTLVEFSDYQ